MAEGADCQSRIACPYWRVAGPSHDESGRSWRSGAQTRRTRPQQPLRRPIGSQADIPPSAGTEKRSTTSSAASPETGSAALPGRASPVASRRRRRATGIPGEQSRRFAPPPARRLASRTRSAAATARRVRAETPQARPRAESPAPGVSPAVPAPLSPLQIQRRFTAAASAAGIEARVTAHSGRVGLASELTARGASTTEVMLAGNWKTARMVAHYSAGATAERGAVRKYL